MKRKSNDLKITLDSTAKEIVESGKGMDLLNLLADKLQAEQLENRNYLHNPGIDCGLTEGLEIELCVIEQRSRINNKRRR